MCIPTITQNIKYIPLDELEDYVHNKAVQGDVLKSVFKEYGIKRECIYICTKDNIGKGIKPYWKLL